MKKEQIVKEIRKVMRIRRKEANTMHKYDFSFYKPHKKIFLNTFNKSYLLGMLEYYKAELKSKKEFNQRFRNIK